MNVQLEKEYDLPKTYICELDFDRLSDERKCAKEYSKFPSTSRDLSLMVPRLMQYSTLEAFILSNAPSELVKCTAIDIYHHESFGDMMSLTLKLQFQSNERTLEEENIATMIEALLSKLKATFGINLR